MLNRNEHQVERSEVQPEKPWYKNANLWGWGILFAFTTFLGTSGVLDIDNWRPRNEINTPTQQP
jgi:hypothetical protein